MRILFDQGTPVPLRQHLTGHLVDTAFEGGWSTLRNGELLDGAEHERYDLLITTDQSLRYQQHLAARALASLCCYPLPGPVYNGGSKRYRPQQSVLCQEGTKKLRCDQATLWGMPVTTSGVVSPRTWG
jgi:hypothetical protein